MSEQIPGGSVEQRARDLLERLGHPTAQNLSAGDVVELANLLNDAKAQAQRIAELEAAHGCDAERWRLVKRALDEPRLPSLGKLAAIGAIACARDPVSDNDMQRSRELAEQFGWAAPPAAEDGATR